MKTSEVLNKAADLIEERGWTQAAGWHPDASATTPVCLLGGLYLAVGVDWVGGTYPLTAKSEKKAAEVALADHLEWDRPLFVWNDSRARDSDHVIEVLRAAAVIEASRERQAAEVSA